MSCRWNVGGKYQPVHCGFKSPWNPFDSLFSSFVGFDPILVLRTRIRHDTNFFPFGFRSLILFCKYRCNDYNDRSVPLLCNICLAKFIQLSRSDNVFKFCCEEGEHCEKIEVVSSLHLSRELRNGLHLNTFEWGKDRFIRRYMRESPLEALNRIEATIFSLFFNQIWLLSKKHRRKQG